MYRALLRLYPASFRAEYAAEMRRDFARRRRDASGPLGLAALWIAACADVVWNAAGVHGQLLAQDLRYAGRSFRNAPGFTATVVLVSALGVGVTTAAFSVTDHVLMRPLPFAGADRLVRLWQSEPQRGYLRGELSPANFRDWRARATSFEAMAVWRNLAFNLSGAGDPERLEGCAVSDALFPILGVPPLLGRTLRRRRRPRRRTRGHRAGLPALAGPFRRGSGRARPPADTRRRVLRGRRGHAAPFPLPHARDRVLDGHALRRRRLRGPHRHLPLRHRPPRARRRPGAGAGRGEPPRRADRAREPADERGCRGRGLPAARRDRAPVARHGDGAARRRLLRAAHRLHQPGEPAARARAGAPAGARRPDRAGRRPRAPAPTAPDRERPAGASWAACWASRSPMRRRRSSRASSPRRCPSPRRPPWTCGSSGSRRP